MSRNIRKSMKKKSSLLLTSALVVTSAVPALGNTERYKNIITEPMMVNSNTQTTTGASVSLNTKAIPEKGKTYLYDFTTEDVVDYTYDKNNRINTLTSQDGLLTINGNGTMYSHQSKHGLVIKENNSFQVEVAGNAVIKFGICKESKGGKMRGSVGNSAGTLSNGEIELKGSIDGQEVAFIYIGEATTLTFSVQEVLGDNYLHSIEVENLADGVKPWASKDFSISIGNTDLAVTGAATEVDEADITLSSGQVYYTKSENAFVSLDLNNNVLSDSMLGINSPNTVDTVEVDANGDIVVTFKDQLTAPATYTIKVQDQSQYKTPGIKDAYAIQCPTDTELQEFPKDVTIKESYTTNNGIFTIGKGTGSKAPYYHGSHGIAISNGNYIDVVVAGDATISFAACQHSKANTLICSNLASNGNGSFDNNSLVASSCNDAITYTYTGDATTLRFTVSGSNEAYLHGITVKNTGTLAASPVVNAQAAMPQEVDASSTLDVTPVGHRLMFDHSNTSASTGNLNEMGYYLFDSCSEAVVIEADIEISSMSSGSGQGIFFGMFNEGQDISNIATLGIRGDGKIRNMYNKTTDPSTPGAGSIDQTYNLNDTIHVLLKKTADGWYSEFTQNDTFADATIKYSNTVLLDDIDTSVRYGFGFSNVTGQITNLTFKDENGNVLYDQNDCYEAIGTAPQVQTVDVPVLSADRTSVTVNWSGDSCKDDEGYKVELSKDGGYTYTVLSKHVTSNTYTATVDESGEYIFRITGVCGNDETIAIKSPSLQVVAPLDKPVLKGESADSAITLNWQAVDKATSYAIYRKSATDSNFNLVGEISELTFTDTNVINEEPYYYYVIAQSHNNTSNPSDELLMVASAGREGEYVYEDESTEIFLTKKSYDTVYKDEAVLEGIVDQSGELSLEVNGQVQESIALNKKEAFSLVAKLEEGRNDVNLLFTDENGKVTRSTFNFVYLTNYDIVVDQNYKGIDGELSTDGLNVPMYSSIQAAVDSVPANNTDRVVILVKEGNYREYLRVTSPYITLIGEDREKVNINYYDKATTPAGGDTDKRCAIYVQSSATGFSAENLTMENTYEYLGDGSISNESADALRVDADAATFVNVKLMGYQDTLQVNKNHQYFYKCYILGNIDYIYGTDSRTLFEDCDLVYRYNSNKNSGYIAAPKTDAQYEYGYIFNNCRILAEEGCNGSKYLLARPWGPDGSATFINTYMSGIVNKEAPYASMSGNAYQDARFAEYYSYGEGYAINGNRPQIAKAKAEEMLTTTFLGWDPYTTAEEVSSNDYVGNMVTNTEDKFVEKEYIDETADPDATDDTGLGAYTIEGYGSKVTGGGVLLETASNYYQVDTAEAFLEALTTIKKSGKASVIELTADIGLGSLEIGSAINTYSDIIKPAKYQALLHPTLIQTGISTLKLEDMSNLTIYSKNGSKLEHVCMEINNSSNVMIRNIVFDGIWEWDEETHGNYDRNDWDYITIQNGSTDIWIDHCTFYKAYDGIVDVKKADGHKTSDVTISWCQFLPESSSDFFDEMMDLLESNQAAYPYYNELITTYEMTKEQVRGYAAGQKKTHLIGASDTEANMKNLQVTLANNYYKDSMDRMPRMRGGNAHMYNCVLDASDLLELKDTITNREAKKKVVSKGAISTCGASVLLENTHIQDIMHAIVSGNSGSSGGYIDAINSVYYMYGEEIELVVEDSAGAGMILDAEAFITNLPYQNYHLYNALELKHRVLPFAGAGVVDMSSVQWQKTKYNAEVVEVPIEKEKVSVTLDYNGATGNCEITKVELAIGEAYGQLPRPTKNGYDFLGWYDANGKRVTAKTIVTEKENHTLLAKWGIESLDDDNDNNSAVQNPTVDKDTTASEKPVDKEENTQTPSEEVITNFKDVKTHWAYDSIKVMTDRGLLKGVTESEFKPNDAMTRSMFVTVLHRLAGEPAVTEGNTFTDVKSGAWYENAIVWANSLGVVTGMGHNTFSPNSEMTREQLAVMLYNYIQLNQIEVEKVAEEVEFKDSREVSAWAKDAMTFMAQTGIMQGDRNQKVNPKAQATRAEVSTMLQRFLEKVDA